MWINFSAPSAAAISPATRSALMLYVSPAAPTPTGAITGTQPPCSSIRIASTLTASTSPTRPMSTVSPLGRRCSRRRARRRLASLPEMPIALPPWWLMSPTISLLILPTSTISTISTVSWSVTRIPPTKRGSLPRRFIRAPICGPPPSTMTGLMPTSRRRITSLANNSFRSARSIAAPPFLMTMVLPRNSRMYGRASRRISTWRGSVMGPPRARPSQDVPRQVLVAGDVGEPLLHVLGVDDLLLAGHVGRVERDLLEQLLHDRVQTPGADVLRALVDLHRDLGDLVELVEEHDAGVLGSVDRLGDHLVHVDELLGLLLHEEPPRLGDTDPAPLRLGGHEVRQHVFEMDAHLLHTLAGEDLDHGQGVLLGFQLDEALVEPPGAELATELLLRRFPRGVRGDLLQRPARVRLRRTARQQDVEQPLLRELLRLLLHVRHHLGLDDVHRQLGQVADHRLDVAPDVADLGVLRRLDLEERRLRQLGQAAGHFGLPDSGGADHDDVLRRHLVAELGRDALPPPAVAERDRDGALGLFLADDVAVELGHDLRRGQGRADVRVGHCSGVHEAGFDRGWPDLDAIRLRTPGLSECVVRLCFIGLRR